MPPLPRAEEEEELGQRLAPVDVGHDDQAGARPDAGRQQLGTRQRLLEIDQELRIIDVDVHSLF